MGHALDASNYGQQRVTAARRRKRQRPRLGLRPHSLLRALLEKVLERI